MEDNFPQLEVKVHGRVHATANSDKFVWSIKTALVGPDDVMNTEQDGFTNRQSATEDMLDRFETVVKEHLTELLA